MPIFTKHYRKSSTDPTPQESSATQLWSDSKIGMGVFYTSDHVTGGLANFNSLSGQDQEVKMVKFFFWLFIDFLNHKRVQSTPKLTQR